MIYALGFHSRMAKRATNNVFLSIIAEHNIIFELEFLIILKIIYGTCITE